MASRLTGIGMRPHNPTRRNRNIGTAKSGHGQDNRMAIPERGMYLYWERIDGAREVIRTVSGRTIKFFVQPTRDDCVYACTIDDLTQLLSYLPAPDWEGMEALLLRQPRRKEETLEPVWGRLSYAAEFVNARGRVLYQGPAIVIEAVNLERSINLGKGLSLAGSAELERLKSDGHHVRSGKNHIVEPSLEGCRATQLYRTLPHEVGHWVEFLEKVQRPSNKDESLDYETLLDRFHSRPAREKEEFAHAYADRFRERLIEDQLIPFARQFDPARIAQDNLLLQDFEAASD